MIAAGTGLGEAILFWDGAQHLPMATEGGHADFAPHTNQQADLWKFLKQSEEFVSAEIFCRVEDSSACTNFWILRCGMTSTCRESIRHPESRERGLSGECPVCAATLDLWVDIYGSEAGNLAVRSMARGGIFVTGGIAVKILPKMTDGRFAAAVKDKEKMGTVFGADPGRDCVE